MQEQYMSGAGAIQEKSRSDAGAIQERSGAIENQSRIDPGGIQKRSVCIWETSFSRAREHGFLATSEATLGSPWALLDFYIHRGSS
eukprot:8634419-Karenia_brevis.AAC.1